MEGTNILNETKEQKECPYCHGDSRTLMDSETSEADVWVSGQSLYVWVYDKCGVRINYCPKCGRRLG
ncbi:hypothetical protein LAC03_24320 [Levilactobacillus acidifarinae]|nr:hypothetical protein LAC03_24320 [Levilactobacillus acidifarinae]